MYEPPTNIFYMERQFNGYPVPEFREMFEIATDVKDNKLEKALFEADKLDFTPQVGLSYFGVESQYIDGDPDHVGGKTILCYYAFARYLQSADQASTSTGLKLQTYGGSVVVPDTSKTKRFEAERGKADIFMEQFITWLRRNGVLACAKVSNTRIGLIK